MQSEINTQEPLLRLYRELTPEEQKQLLLLQIGELKQEISSLKFKNGELLSENAELEDAVQKNLQLTEAEKLQLKKDEYIQRLLTQIKDITESKKLDKIWESRYYALLGSQLSKAC